MTRRRIPLFWSTLIALAVIWLVLDAALPYLAMWITGRERPLPIPAAARAAYLLLAFTGAAVYVTIDDDSAREFVRPIVAFFRGPDPATRHARWAGRARLALLVLLPLVLAGFVFARAAPRVQSPTILRIQHPTIPGPYERLKNPFREPTDEAVRKWATSRQLGGNLAAARKAYGDAALAEGRVIFQINCRPCHGDAADGAGPMARGFRLRPANFSDPGTIATVVEAYAFWRVTEGGPGLPPEATPWDSAMPIWRQDLTDDQKWKAVMAAYDLADVEPRRPEKLGAAMGTPSLGLLRALTPGPAAAQLRPAETPEAIARGKQIYLKRCQACHGEKGDGQGPVAPFLDPRPRDFTSGVYKLRTTETGQPPTDEDLFRVLARGVPGTAMSDWTRLSTEDRWLVIAHIKRFSDAFKEKVTVIRTSRDVPGSSEIISRGKELYQNAKCWECHGQAGRGDGPNAPTLKDDLGNAIKAANLRQGWRLKGGREAREIFLRLSTGLDGTPMPSYADSLNEEERWALAHYVKSLQTVEEPSADVVLRATRIAGELPHDPDDLRWRATPFLAVALAGQVVAKARWENHSVGAVTVRALYNGRAVGFLLEWDDRFKDVEHHPGPPPDLDEYTYPRLELHRRRTDKLRDAIRLQFPVRIPDGPERPHFFLGNPGRPVALWHWKADALGVVKEIGEGVQRPISEQSTEAQDVSGTGVWKDGRWRVIMTRALVPRDRAKDVTFEPGRLIPFAVQVWDGSNGERDLMMSLSSWNFIILEAALPLTAYLFPVLAVAVVGLGEWWLIRRVRR